MDFPLNNAPEFFKGVYIVKLGGYIEMQNKGRFLLSKKG